MKTLRDENGQSTIMVVGTLLVLIALVALVLDIGNAYAQRRVAQNAADAAALAAGQELARGFEYTTNRKILTKAKDFAQINGIDPNEVVADYVRFDPETHEYTILSQISDNTAHPPAAAAGVRVNLGKVFNAYLAPMLGLDVLAAGAESIALTSRGVCTPGADPNLFPVAVDASKHAEVGLNNPTTIWGEMVTGGNFHWVSWDLESGHTSLSTLIDNMQNTNTTHELAAPRDESHLATVYSGPGMMVAAEIRPELDRRIADDNCRDGGLNPVLVPLYDNVENPGEGGIFDVVGYTGFCITGYKLTDEEKYLEGYFVDKNVPATEGGCSDFGTYTVKLRPALDLTRNIAGQVAYERLIPIFESAQTAKPVDVIYVLDISGSMSNSWGTGLDYQQKIQTAKDVLIEFNNSLQAEIGDQAGLVKFPVQLANFATDYEKACGGTSNARYGAQLVQPLTTDLALVSAEIKALSTGGYTSLASAMQKAVQAVIDPNTHVPGHQQIIILASDGMGNVSLNEHLTGWSGAGSEPLCNTGVSNEAIDMANQAKAAGVTVFTVALGSDFLTYILETIATPDTDPAYPHFFSASDPAAMREIYSSLGERITDFRECVLKSEDAPGAGAVVTLYKNGTKITQTTTDDAGNFIFSRVASGTYTFGVTLNYKGTIYDVFTNKVGGYELDSVPQLKVPDQAGTYYIHLAVKTGNPPNCEL